MFRKRMKTHTGCQVCKTRRKKCDEEKPVCGSCRRLKLRCTWLLTSGKSKSVTDSICDRVVTNSALGDIEFSLVPTSRCRPGPPAGCLGQGYQPFRDQIQFDLTTQSATSLRGLISRTANPEFQDTSFLVVLALHNGWLRDVFASFSAHTLLAPQRRDHTGQELGPFLYRRAVSSLRSHLASTQASSGTIEVLAAMTFLGMSDSLGTGDANHAIVHFAAAATICKTLRLASAKTKAERMLYRISVECWLYNLSTLCLFHEDCDKIIRCVDWTVISDCSEESSQENCISLRTSPFLGGMAGIYKLTMQMTWYARQNEPLRSRQQQKLIWSAALDMLEAQINAYFAMLPSDTAQLYFSKFLFHTYALRVLLEKIADRGLRSCDPVIRSYVKEAGSVLKSSAIQERRNPALAWPLIIILCAAHEQTIFDFYINIIAEIDGNFDQGHTQRMNDVLDTIREQRVKGQCGLDLLLRKRGIFIPDSSVEHLSKSCMHDTPQAF